MIELRDDALYFQFPQVLSELKLLADNHMARILPHELAKDPNACLQRLLYQEYPNLSESSREEVKRRVAALTSADIVKRFCVLAEDEISKVAPRLKIGFMRTLRLPDDGKTYPLPAGLGEFPLRHIEDHAERAPAEWVKRGGVMMPMYQAEALWLAFEADYPMALKVGTGKINAVNGEPWREGLVKHPQGYVVLPEQRWLDGFCAAPGVVRQFVAAGMGNGYTAEEQITGEANFGGIQLQAYPVKAASYFEKRLKQCMPTGIESVVRAIIDETIENAIWSRTLQTSPMARSPWDHITDEIGMGLGAGGKINQEILEDPWDAEDWDTSQHSRCFVHLCLAMEWEIIAGEAPPHQPFTAKEYAKQGIPWFDYYQDELGAVEGSEVLANLKTVQSLGKKKQDPSIPKDTPVSVGEVHSLGSEMPEGMVVEWDGKS